MATQPGYLLVVEDVSDIQQLLRATLSFKGYRVVMAWDGLEALAAIEKERPALIITDIMMPRMDGFNLVHRLRLNPETRDIPVIFLSATYVAPEDKAFSLTIGVTRFIEKPVDLPLFLETIEQLLKQGVPGATEPLNEYEFYVGYRKRLETKLKQKQTQIARDEHVLETLPEAEKLSFKNSLQLAINERDEIQRLLDQIQGRLRRFPKHNK